jgi:hypothetical protein
MKSGVDRSAIGFAAFTPTELQASAFDLLGIKPK